MINLALIFTQRCNVHCRHCSLDRLIKPLDMPLKDAFRYIDETAAMSYEEGGFSLYLSGGEPFLRYEELLAVIRYGKYQGADQVMCVTNGFWGQDVTSAKNRASELLDAGVCQLSFSLDDFHQEHIPIGSILNALTACRETGLCFAIKSSVTRNTRRLPQILNDLGDLLLDAYVPIQEMAYVPLLNGKDRISENEWLMREKIPNEPCTELRMLAVLPDGTTYPCCGSGWSQRLVIGNALTETLTKLWNKVKESPLLILLQDKGPGFIIQYSANDNNLSRQESYINRCHVCRTILGHPRSEQIIQLALDDWTNGMSI